MKKIKLNIPLACAHACGGAMIGGIFGIESMYMGALMAFIFSIYNNK